MGRQPLDRHVTLLLRLGVLAEEEARAARRGHAGPRQLPRARIRRPRSRRCANNAADRTAAPRCSRRSNSRPTAHPRGRRRRGRAKSARVMWCSCWCPDSCASTASSTSGLSSAIATMPSRKTITPPGSANALTPGPSRGVRKTMRRAGSSPAAFWNARKRRVSSSCRSAPSLLGAELGAVESGEDLVAQALLEGRRDVARRPVGNSRQPFDIEPCRRRDKQDERDQRCRPGALPAHHRRLARAGACQRRRELRRLLDVAGAHHRRVELDRGAWSSGSRRRCSAREDGAPPSPLEDNGAVGDRQAQGGPTAAYCRRTTARRTTAAAPRPEIAHFSSDVDAEEIGSAFTDGVDRRARIERGNGCVERFRTRRCSCSRCGSVAQEIEANGSTDSPV